MTRAYQNVASRRTQPLMIIKRDPSIRSLGFTTFRALRIPGDPNFLVVAFTERRNTMSAFTRLGQ